MEQNGAQVVVDRSNGVETIARHKTQATATVVPVESPELLLAPTHHQPQHQQNQQLGPEDPPHHATKDVVVASTSSPPVAPTSTPTSSLLVPLSSYPPKARSVASSVAHIADSNVNANANGKATELQLVGSAQEQETAFIPVALAKQHLERVVQDIQTLKQQHQEQIRTLITKFNAVEQQTKSHYEQFIGQLKQTAKSQLQGEQDKYAALILDTKTKELQVQQQLEAVHQQQMAQEQAFLDEKNLWKQEMERKLLAQEEVLTRLLDQCDHELARVQQDLCSQLTKALSDQQQERSVIQDLREQCQAHLQDLQTTRQVVEKTHERYEMLIAQLTERFSIQYAVQVCLQELVHTVEVEAHQGTLDHQMEVMNKRICQLESMVDTSKRQEQSLQQALAKATLKFQQVEQAAVRDTVEFLIRTIETKPVRVKQPKLPPVAPAPPQVLQIPVETQTDINTVEQSCQTADLVTSPTETNETPTPVAPVSTPSAASSNASTLSSPETQTTPVVSAEDSSATSEADADHIDLSSNPELLASKQAIKEAKEAVSNAQETKNAAKQRIKNWLAEFQRVNQREPTLQDKAQVKDLYLAFKTAERRLNELKDQLAKLKEVHHAKVAELDTLGKWQVGPLMNARRKSVSTAPLPAAAAGSAQRQENLMQPDVLSNAETTGKPATKPPAQHDSQGAGKPQCSTSSSAETETVVHVAPAALNPREAHQQETSLQPGSTAAVAGDSFSTPAVIERDESNSQSTIASQEAAAKEQTAQQTMNLSVDHTTLSSSTGIQSVAEQHRQDVASPQPIDQPATDKSSSQDAVQADSSAEQPVAPQELLHSEEKSIVVVGEAALTQKEVNGIATDEKQTPSSPEDPTTSIGHHALQQAPAEADQSIPLMTEGKPIPVEVQTESVAQRPESHGLQITQESTSEPHQDAVTSPRSSVSEPKLVDDNQPEYHQQESTQEKSTTPPQEQTPSTNDSMAVPAQQESKPSDLAPLTQVPPVETDDNSTQTGPDPLELQARADIQDLQAQIDAIRRANQELETQLTSARCQVARLQSDAEQQTRRMEQQQQQVQDAVEAAKTATCREQEASGKVEAAQEETRKAVARALEAEASSKRQNQLLEEVQQAKAVVDASLEAAIATQRREAEAHAQALAQLQAETEAAAAAVVEAASKADGKDDLHQTEAEEAESADAKGDEEITVDNDEEEGKEAAEAKPPNAPNAELVSAVKQALEVGKVQWNRGEKAKAHQTYVAACERAVDFFKRIEKTPSEAATFRTALQEADKVPIQRGAMILRRKLEMFVNQMDAAAVASSPPKTASGSSPTRKKAEGKSNGSGSPTKAVPGGAGNPSKKNAALDNTSAEPSDAKAAGAAGVATSVLLEEYKSKVKALEAKSKADRVKLNQLEAALAKAEAKAASGGGGGGGFAKDDEVAKRLLDKKIADADKKHQKQLEEAENAARKEISSLTSQLDQTKQQSASLQQQVDAMKTQLSELGGKANQLSKVQEEMSALHQRAQEADALQTELAGTRANLSKLETSYKEEQALRKKYYNMIEDMKGKIRVFARCRPMSTSETERGCSTCVRFLDEYSMEVDSAHGPKQYSYDRAFTQLSTQEEVFEDTKMLMQSAIDGYNVCIFAYGQTGSGKTFTMTGNDALPGLTPRAIHHLFELAASSAANNLISFQAYMCELYNDALVDLFYLIDGGHDKDAPKLEIKKNDKGMVFVQNITIKSCKDPVQTLRLFEAANKKRQVGATKMNAESSRSHSVFSLLVENYNKTTKSTSIGKLSLVDLAGSERAGKTGATAERLKEAQSINKSLSALGDVIAALSSGEKFIPYRNNKLTQLMQDSLGGNAKTLMFVNISPADYNQEETQTSLQYASRVKLITNNANKNAESELVNKLKAIIRQLRTSGKTDESLDELID